MIRHLHKASYYIVHPRRFARNASYERSCFRRIPGTPKKVVVVAVIHHISWATARASPSKHVGGLMGTVGVVVVVSAVHHTSWAAVRAGPSKHIPGTSSRPPHGPGGAAHIEPTFYGPRPGLAHQISEDGPRPGPAHQNFRGWTVARPSPSHTFAVWPR